MTPFHPTRPARPSLSDNFPLRIVAVIRTTFHGYRISEYPRTESYSSFPSFLFFFLSFSSSLACLQTTLVPFRNDKKFNVSTKDGFSSEYGGFLSSSSSAFPRKSISLLYINTLKSDDLVYKEKMPRLKRGISTLKGYFT